jgi:MFS family permease
MIDLLRDRDTILVLACCLIFGCVLGLMCLLVPLYTLALSDSSLILSLVVGTFPLTEILLSLLSGVLSDYLGRRMVIVTGFVCFVGACWVCSAADSHYWLLAGQILLGLGDASIFIAARALLIDSSPSGKQTALQGLGSAAALTGTILGPFVGGCLSEVVGFAATFFVGGVLAVRGKKTWGMAGHLFLILVTVRQYDWPLRGTRPATTPMRPWLQC